MITQLRLRAGEGGGSDISPGRDSGEGREETYASHGTDPSPLNVQALSQISVST